jgi:hypothetical protein
MQFVKASERMPTSTDGRKGKVVVRFLDSPKYDFWNVDSFSVDVDFYGYHYKKEMIEWLDEGNASAEERIKELEKAIWQISLGPEDSDSEWIPYVMQKCKDILTKKQ